MGFSSNISLLLRLVNCVVKAFEKCPITCISKKVLIGLRKTFQNSQFVLG